MVLPDSLVETPRPDAMPEPGEPPHDAAALDAPPGVRPDGPVIIPTDTPVAEASPPDGPPASPPDAALDTAKDAAPDVPLPALLTVSRAVYNAGEAISVTYSNGPGLKADWIGIYDQGAASPSDASRSLLWYYSDNTGWGPAPPGTGPKSGTVTFTTGSKGSRDWPLPSGHFKAIFLSSPYIQLASPASFQVR